MARLSFRFPTIRSTAGAMAIALIAVSVLSALSHTMRDLLVLAPASVLSGFVWQLVTYAFVEESPMGVIFGALITWSLGGALELIWGRKRLLWFSLGVVALSAVVTVLVAFLLSGFVLSSYGAGSVLTSSLWVAYGLHIGRGQTNFWGAPVTGNVLAGIGAGFVLLNAAFIGNGNFALGLSAVMPALLALGFTFLYMRGARPSELLLRFRSWQLERDLKKRSSHLRGIDGGRRNVGGDSDKYLH